MKLTISEPILVHAPEMNEAISHWGVYAIPRMWREPSGELVVHFNDLFKSNFDTTPNRYLTARRIEHAKTMLETKCLTVTEVADLCGFSDVYYFSKVFKQICGVPPSKWK